MRKDRKFVMNTDVTGDQGWFLLSVLSFLVGRMSEKEQGLRGCRNGASFTPGPHFSKGPINFDCGVGFGAASHVTSPLMNTVASPHSR